MGKINLQVWSALLPQQISVTLHALALSLLIPLPSVPREMLSSVKFIVTDIDDTLTGQSHMFEHFPLSVSVANIQQKL